jgi:heme oxygenase (mycobilin-producing)
MFVSHSEIAVAVEQAESLEQAFRARARKVDAHVGFLGLELLRDIGKQGRYLLVTRWRTREDFRAYMKSGDHEAAHARQHAGLDGADKGAPLRQFNLVEL